MIIVLIVRCRLIRGANASTSRNKNPANARRDLILLSALIEYPGVGLILYETGCAEDVDTVRIQCMSCTQSANTFLS